MSMTGLLKLWCSAGFSLVFTHMEARWHRHRVAEGSSSLAHTWIGSNILEVSK